MGWFHRKVGLFDDIIWTMVIISWLLWNKLLSAITLCVWPYLHVPCREKSMLLLMMMMMITLHLRTFLPIVSAHRYFSRKFTCHIIHECTRKITETMIGQMAIAIALPGFSDLGPSVTPTFLSRIRFYVQLSPHCPRMNKKINVGS